MASPFEAELVIVDPDGDLVLKVGSDRSMSEEDETDSQNGNHKSRNSNDDSGSSNDDSDTALQDIKKNEQPKTIRIRVSGKFMTMCSPVFKAMLDGSFREGQLTLSAVEPPILELPEDEPMTMVELCRILHHKWDAALGAFPSCALPIAIAADKYGCTAIIRSWFHHRFYQEKDKPRVLSTSKNDLAQFISIAYILDDAGAFNSFSRQAYLRWRTKDGENEEFISELQRNHLPSKVHHVLERMAEAQLEELSRISSEALVHLCEDSGLKTSFVISTLTRKVEVPQVYDVQAYRVAQYLKALSDLDLWPYGLDSGSLSLEEAICMVRQLAKQQKPNDNTLCFEDECACCGLSWSGTIENEVNLFQDELHGLCLTCLKRKDLSTSKLIQKCKEHNYVSSQYWYVDSGRDTRDYQTLVD
ncbi:uncharacterized protein Z520_00140 [Fonsecaea multimorphosa CBS 102226]|uniref:BTB domain-containing protein n=1 Tax=Fonsecaea multimorphosa CBS 102226 TaxID=1442371 RepID=A0A0D2L345_9EURO|nr:uncharacterized protein Z520_00140 [Fonsecaea multimorphosa CBS 102226]KIY03449.1 hypothetical protein Z520_00140 [Fonsecaea multimorphosa CBS 102226]